MQVKTLVSILAVSTALAFAGPASAQTMFNGAPLSDDDLPKVQARCDELANAATTESISEDGADQDDQSNDAGQADATIESAPQANEDATTAVDLDTVTLEMCNDAGLTTAP